MVEIGGSGEWLAGRLLLVDIHIPEMVISEEEKAIPRAFLDELTREAGSLHHM